ncbi:MAG: PLD nuclease N-terminal domain-containing protein [Candidatus Nanopelagicaceae bacterium]
MVRVLLMYVLPIALTIYAIADIARNDESQIKLLPKWGWFLISILVSIIGPIAWLIAGKTRYRKPPRGKGPKGPDDDPDFLKGL